MRLAAALLTLVAMGALSGSALAQLPPVPVPVPTPPAPSVPVTLPTVPKLPAPVVTDPVAAAPAVAAPAGAAPAAATPSVPNASASGTSAQPQLQVPAIGGGATAQSSDSYSSGTSGSSSTSTSARRPRVKHFHSSRTWIGTSGERARRVTTLTFVLPQAARVLFTVTQVSPDCHVVGRFSFRGKAGLNRVRFAGRVGKQQLGPGTYRIAARTSGGSVVERVLLVVVAGPAPDRSELAAARASNACSATTRETASANATSGLSGSGFTGASAPSIARHLAPQGRPRASAPEIARPDTPLGGVLASSIEETAKAIRPILIVLLAASILLLGLASLPRVAVADSRLNDLLARHRLEIAGVGTAALLAFAITYLVG